MKKLVSFIAVSLVGFSLYAQTDFRGVKVTQNGNTYTATFNKKSDNGGTASEKWTGPLVDGKRHGTWTFTGTYNQYATKSGRARNGSIKMIRNYKNGVPSGSYSVTYNITERDVNYNYFTGDWVYGAQVNMTEKVSGAFMDGKPSGTWNIFSERNHESWNISFVDGYATGVWRSKISGISDEITFKNGYAIHQKTPKDDGSWGYELKYDKDPATIFPQDTIRVGNSFLFYFDTYAAGLFLITDWMNNYPKNASNEDTPAYYILSDYKNHNKPYGNIPYYVLDQMKSDSINEIVKAADELGQKILKEWQDWRMESIENGMLKFCEYLDEQESDGVISSRDISEPKLTHFANWEKLQMTMLLVKTYKAEVDSMSAKLDECKRSSGYLDNVRNIAAGVDVEKYKQYHTKFIQCKDEYKSLTGKDKISNMEVWNAYGNGKINKLRATKE